MERLRAENEALKTELRELTQHQGAQLPDLEAVRDSILNSLKLGTQSPQYKSVRKALDQFIREVKQDE